MKWIDAFLTLFSYFGWALFVTVFDTAIEYQTGRGNLQSVFLNVLKGFMAVNLFTKVPVLLYQFCVTLQRKFTDDLLSAFTNGNSTDSCFLPISRGEEFCYARLQ